MRLLGPAGPLWLGYCTNVLPVETPDDLNRVLGDLASPLADRLAPDEPFGVGLHVTDRAARELLADPESLDRLRDTLARGRLVPFTANAFPIGGFHADVVKESVYRPDWTEEVRVAYTSRAARVLASLLPEGATGSVSTVAGGWKSRVAGREAAIAANLVGCARELVTLESETSRRIVLCLEPEPLTMLETTEEVLAFFGRLLPRDDPAVRRHLGICYDCCHQAVEHEDLAASLDRIAAAGIRIGKVQMSNALEVPRLDEETLAALREFAEPRWLHQVVARNGAGDLVRSADLTEVLADLDAWRDRLPWRIHFHVPIERETCGPLATTRADLEAAVRTVVRRGLCDHLEVETYTWSTLANGDEDLADGLERELRFARGLVDDATTSAAASRTPRSP